jgi:pilus assembly protein CpaF
MDNSNSFLVLFLEPIRAYLEDDDVSEIMINGPTSVYIEKKGKLQKTDAKFISEPALKAAASNIAKSVGRLLNEDNPRLDARLPDGSRVHAVIPPLARCGTVIAIRKFKRDTITIDKMLGFGSLSEDAIKLIRALVLLHKNVIVSGATSSGKTSVLNALSSFIPNGERVLVIEDASELQLQQEHIVPFETRKPDKNGNGEVTIRDLIHSSLRLRPDRLVIGEIRGGEALDLLQALNTGHAGSMSTIHANTSLDCLFRLETCALLSGIDIPLVALRAQVASAIDAVVHTGRLSDGSRKILAISEVLPLKNGEYQVSDLLVWQTDTIAPDGKVIGRFVLKNKPTFVDQAAIAKLELPEVSH